MITSTVNDLQLTISKFQMTKYAQEVLAGTPTEEELGMLFEEQQFSPSLEEYLFLKMDESESQSYIEVVKEEVSKLLQTQFVLCSV